MHVYSVIGETRNREVEVWEELDLRNFYISFATAVPTRPQEQKEERVQGTGQGNLYLWMAGLCVMVSCILSTVSLVGLMEGPIIAALFIFHALMVILLLMRMARSNGQSTSVKF